jgi:Fe-S-cluster containining protein
MNMNGFVNPVDYPYGDYDKRNNDGKAYRQFNDDFILIEVLEGVRICPLAVNSKCLIYEDRPNMCRIFKCEMKCVLT